MTPTPPPTVTPTATRPAPWLLTLGCGAAVLLAAGPVGTVVGGGAWFGHAALAVVVVLLTGLLAHRGGLLVVVLAQLAALLLLLTARFTDDGVLGVLPGPAAFGDLAALFAAAGREIDTGVPPVNPTAPILFLVTTAFGLLAVAVALAAVGAAAPAAAGVPLLAVFAVPAALSDDLLPWWTVGGAALAFGLLLVLAGTGTGGPSDGAGMLGRSSGVALIAVALIVALGVGTVGVLGTAGRFTGPGTGPGGGQIGLTPFTSLRGQLERTAPDELFRVTGLARPTYLRALTLRQFRPDVGWAPTRPAPGLPLPGPLPGSGGPGDVVEIDLDNVGFRDYWLPVIGDPLEITGLSEAQWLYDPASGTGYTARPREEDGWRLRTLLPTPSAAELRAAPAAVGDAVPADGGAVPADAIDAGYLDATGLDPRVVTLAEQVVAQAPTPFDRAVALQEFFVGPTSPFRYQLSTAPGGGDDPLVEFLTVGQVGYCEQYASAMAIMLRAVGVPARVAVGFTAGANLGAGVRSIRTADAHAWVEAYFPGVGWTTFDPTPLADGRRIEPPYVTEARTGPVDEQGPDADLAPTSAAPAPSLNQQDQLDQQAVPAGATAGTGQGGASWPWVLGAVVLLGAALAAAPTVLRRAQRRRRWADAAAGGPGAAAAGWQELLATSTDRGVPVRPSDTVRGAARRLAREHGLDDDARDALRTVVAAVEASWYGDADPPPQELVAPLATVRAGITAGATLPWRRRLVPASLRETRPRRRSAVEGPTEQQSTEQNRVTVGS